MSTKVVDAANAFTAQLGARHPDWLPFATPTPLLVEGRDVPGVRLEMPSPAGGPTLWLELTSGDATVGLGEQAAERLFVWQDPAERDAAFDSIFHCLNDITSGELLVVWKRRRFLWKSWASASFMRAADAPSDPAVVRAEAWPAPSNNAS